MIEQVTDKILEYLDEVLIANDNNNFFLFANVLDKKSKVRNYFEKKANCGAIACYEDNDITLKGIASNRLKNFQPIPQKIINMIVENCSEVELN